MRSANWKQQLGHLGYFLFTAFFVAGAAFFNKFPLVRESSGAYLEASFSLENLAQETMAYPWLIRATTWQATVWTIVLVQAFLLNFLLLRVTKLLVPGLPLRFVHFPVVLLLALFSSMTWVTSTLHPDIFLSLGLLAGFVFVWDDELRRPARIFLGAVLVGSFWTKSEFVLYAIMVTPLLLAVWFWKRKLVSARLKKRFLLGMGLLLLPFVLTEGVHLISKSAFHFDSHALATAKVPHPINVAKQLGSGNFTRYPLYWEDNPDPQKAYIAEVIHQRLPHEFGEYMNCRQNRDNLQLWYISWLNLPLLFLSLAVLIWGMSRGQTAGPWAAFLYLVGIGTLLNALLQTSLGDVDDFAGARMSWLLLYAALLMGVSPLFKKLYAFRD